MCLSQCDMVLDLGSFVIQDNVHPVCLYPVPCSLVILPSWFRGHEMFDTDFVFSRSEGSYA